MRVIAHRANINGPSKENENKISQIYKCLDKGFDVEIDIRLIKNKLYLGHDQEAEIIDIKELIKIKEKCWIHCKNIDVLAFFNKRKEKFNYFWHERDSYTLTSFGYIWTYPGEKLTNECVLVMPELNIPKEDISFLTKNNFYAICTDYPNLII